MTIRQATPKDFKGFYDINLQADTHHRLAVPSRFREPTNVDYELFMFNRFCDLSVGNDSIF